MSRDSSPVATPSQTAGPFFHLGLPQVLPSATGRGIHLVVRVTDGNGDPVDDALVELWYVGEHSREDGGQVSGAASARQGTDAQGRCKFSLPAPARSDPTTAPRSSPHVNVCVFARGLLRQLCTRLYFEGDETLEHDGLLALVPAERRHTLIARRHAGERWIFDVRLQGPGETVFFAT